MGKQTELSRQARQGALQTRRIKDYQNQLIHHSDCGSQYIYAPYLNTLRQHQIQISMYQMVLENAHAERVNGIIKNEHLYYWNIQTFEQAQRYLEKAAQAYNQDRPHQSLGFLCPDEFETKLLDTPPDRRTKLRVFTEKTRAVPLDKIALF
jgi:putative transposase